MTAKCWYICSMVTMSFAVFVNHAVYNELYLNSRAIAVTSAISPLMTLFRMYQKDVRGEPARLLHAHHMVCAPISVPAQPQAPSKPQQRIRGAHATLRPEQACTPAASRCQRCPRTLGNRPPS